MRTMSFFHGWRRKVGVVSLVMALIATGLWIRSRDLFDTVSFPVLATQHRIYVVDGSLIWCAGSVEGRPEWSFESKAPKKDDTLLPGFAGWSIPLWQLAIPLTLLSAYLIVWKPRKRKSSDQPTNQSIN